MKFLVFKGIDVKDIAKCECRGEVIYVLNLFKVFRVFEYCTCINYHMDKVLKVSFWPAREKCSKWNAF